MQRLDFRNQIHYLTVQLKSKQIIELFDHEKVRGDKLMSIVIESKASYDRNSPNKRWEYMFKNFQLHELYTTEFFSGIINVLSSFGASTRPRTDFLNHQNLSTFYIRHKSLISSYNLVNEVLIDDLNFFDDQNNFDFDRAQNEGNLILEAICETNISLNNLLAIISHLDKLLEVVYFLYEKIENEVFDEPPVVSLIDSGSDINFVIKIPEKAANLIAQIIKQLWDLTVNTKSYRFNQKLKDVEQTVSVMGKINEANANGTIDSETAAVLKKGIFDNVKKLISSNTVPKQILLESKEFTSRQILLEQNKIYQIEQGGANDSSDVDAGAD